MHGVAPTAHDEQRERWVLGVLGDAHFFVAGKAGARTEGVGGLLRCQ